MPMSGMAPAAAEATIFSKRSPTMRSDSYWMLGYLALNSLTKSAPTSSLKGNMALVQWTILPWMAAGLVVSTVAAALPQAAASGVVARAVVAASRRRRVSQGMGV